MFDYLSPMIFLPILAGAALMVLPVGAAMARTTGLAVSIICFALGAGLFARFEGTGALEFVTRIPWVPEFGINYVVGIDGISLMILMLIAVLFPLAYLLLWNHDKRGFWAGMLIAQGAMVGTVAAADLVLFYVFWEVMLLPIFFMIGLYGGAGRIAATIKITVYTMAGSLLMLLGILALAVAHQEQFGSWSFAMADLLRVDLAAGTAVWVFAAFVIAFAIKIPLFPLHTWLPDAYTEAPTGATFVLSAIMAKLGVFAVARYVLPLFPEQFVNYAFALCVLALIGMIWCGVIAIRQPDIKRMLAYSSASHLGMIAVGVFAMNLQSVTGSVFQIVAHAMATGVLFLMVGLLEERMGTREISALGGIAKKAPVYATMFAIAMLASCGLPGTNGFIGEFLIILGALKYNVALGVVAATSVLVGVSYMLWMYQRVIFEKTNDLTEGFRDLNMRELLGIAPVILLIILMGVYPQPFLSKIEPTVEVYLEQIKSPVALAELADDPQGGAQ